MYPRYGPAGGGLLRLHSTYRHDLKIYSSDEGRVQMSAAAFTQGLLDLEGHSLTPILVRRARHLVPLLSTRGQAHSQMHGLCHSLVLFSRESWHAPLSLSDRWV